MGDRGYSEPRFNKDREPRMKPKHIGVDTTLTAKKFKVETPIGTLESDSGSHIVDVASVVIVIMILYLGRHLFKKYIK